MFNFLLKPFPFVINLSGIFYFRYIGRKHMSKDKEYFVEGSNMLVYAKYSYWTLGYIITLKGAQKLIAGDPLGKMVLYLPENTRKALVF